MSASDFVELHDGPILPLEVLRLAWALEERGCRLRLDGDGLIVSPGRLLTDEDREQIRRWRWHLLALVAYEPKRVQ